MSEAVVQQIVNVLGEKRTFLLTTHIHPDGDAIGSVLALRAALVQMGKACEVVNTDGVPQLCSFVPTCEFILAQPTCARADVGLILDCSGQDRIAAPPEALAACDLRIIIDHHQSSQPNADLNWIDPTASATGELIYELIKRLPVEIDATIATCLYTALATDTGGFRFSNTTPRVLRAAAELVERGADPHKITYHLFEERSAKASKILGIALSRLQQDCGGRLTWSVLDRATFDALQADDDDIENVVNFVRNVRGTEIGVLFREGDDGRVRVSLRSNSRYDVSRIAEEFGGGGHRAAAGCRLRTTLEDAVARVLHRARQVLAADGPSSPMNHQPLTMLS
ncbi:MAG: bifunctional oligoribonuclease/PAP phosphatase NrnA [Abditibacteriales bacterium]|nr:bifunctional oligoribonuclease/PAP phosphatase NrnA [Abditibacteriales bacterium]MDW8367316.1 bifunctional oligoribonuclease/PAP phosphatase NrnA [Abditibacteriales bacterium]